MNNQRPPFGHPRGTPKNATFEKSELLVKSWIALAYITSHKAHTQRGPKIKI